MWHNFVKQKMSIKTIFIFIFFVVAGYLQAQNNSFEYIPKNLDSLKVYLKAINSNQIERTTGEFSSKIKKLLKDRDEKVVKSIEDSIYVFNSSIRKNLNNILHEIYKSNPEIDSRDYYFFINNSIVPNATCYGDGMFEINLGLFTRLDSDDELTFVICHEIAHKLLDHAFKGISNTVAAINSKETKNKVNQIKRAKYGQTRAALSVIDELNIDFLNYSKEVEAEADSLGYIMYQKTKYVKYKALTSLNKLRKIDEMIFHYDVKLDSVFNFEIYPFKAYWLKESTSLFDTDKKINEFELVSDTLKTHPEIEFRINKLILDFDIKKNNSDLEISKEFLSEIKAFAQKQSIDYTYDLKFLDFAIYQLVEKFEKNLIEADYYYTKMAMVLQRIYETKKNHEMGKYVPPKNEFSDEKQLNIIRLFLHNLELVEIKKIGLAFCESNQYKIKKNQQFEEVYSFFKNINNQ